MSDGITDGTYQSKIPEINIKRTTDHKNVYADTAIYQVMATFGTETIQIFEADNKERAQSFIDSIISNGYLCQFSQTIILDIHSEFNQITFLEYLGLSI